MKYSPILIMNSEKGNEITNREYSNYNNNGNNNINNNINNNNNNN